LRHKFGDVELAEIAVRGLMERKAIEDSRKATCPPKPEDYKFEVSKNFVVPQGIELVGISQRFPTARLEPRDPHGQRDAAARPQ
jgi:hypothetical protein